VRLGRVFYHQDNYNPIFIFLAVCLATSSVGLYFKRPTPIGHW
jgi:hypothetical protein